VAKSIVPFHRYNALSAINHDFVDLVTTNINIYTQLFNQIDSPLQERRGEQRISCLKKPPVGM